MFLSSTAFAAILLSMAAVLLSSAVVCFCSITMIPAAYAMLRVVGRRCVEFRFTSLF